MIDIAARPGLIRRAGFAGMICGLDHGAALQLAPAGVNRELFAELLAWAERGVLAGAAKQEKDHGG